MARKKLKCGCRQLVTDVDGIHIVDTDLCKRHEKELKEDYKRQKNKRVS